MSTLDKQAEVRFNYVWDWWKFHAGQRTQMFNYFVVITTLLLNVYAAALKGYFEFAVVIAAFGALISLGFFVLDIRNRYQLEKADGNLQHFENDYLSFTEAFDPKKTTDYKTMAGIDEASTKLGAQGFVKHKFVLRVIELLTFFGWVLLLIWSIQNPSRFVIPPAG
jgi:hypothetical protein